MLNDPISTVTSGYSRAWRRDYRALVDGRVTDPTMMTRFSALNLNFLTGTLDPRITFTRASSATFFGSDGLLKTQGYNLAAI